MTATSIKHASLRAHDLGKPGYAGFRNDADAQVAPLFSGQREGDTTCSFAVAAATAPWPPAMTEEPGDE